MTVRRKLLVTALALAAVTIVVQAGAWSAFRATGQNSGNTFASGTVAISDNDSATAMLGFANAQPGTADSSCIKVTYDGSLPSSVRLYGTTGGTGLDAHLLLKVTRGVYSGTEPSFDACTNFQADPADYIGAGDGVVYNGTLQAFPDTYAGGLVDPTAASPESWTSGETHVYRFEVALQNDSAAQGKSASQTFTWEARNQ